MMRPTVRPAIAQLGIVTPARMTPARPAAARAPVRHGHASPVLARRPALRHVAGHAGARPKAVAQGRAAPVRKAAAHPGTGRAGHKG